MSSIFNGIFGGSNSSSNSNSQSSSSNQAYPTLLNNLSPTIGTGGQAGTQIANMLGLNGPQSQNAGFQNWQNSTGYQFGLNQGVQSITGNAATSGLLNSGSTAKALDTYGQNYANTQYQNYLNPLQNLLTSGNQAAGVLGSAGNVSQSTGTSSSTAFNGGQSGISPFLGSLLSK